MVLTSSYNTLLLAATIGVSYTLGAIMMGYLALRFYFWFKINKNSVVLAYTLASAALCTNIIITLVYVIDLITEQPLIMRHAYRSAISENTIPYLGYVLSGIIGFILTWIATSLLMRHHSARDGRGKPTYPVIATTHHEVRSLNNALLYTVRINSADDECCYYKTI